MSEWDFLASFYELFMNFALLMHSQGSDIYEISTRMNNLINLAQGTQ